MKGYKNMAGRLSKKNESSMNEVVKALIRDLGISSGLNEHKIYEAWDKVSGASAYTVSKYVRNNVLYCGIASSVIRSRLYMKKNELIEGINLLLAQDELFVRNDPRTGFLRDIVLR